MYVLLTGFDPFDGEASNPSQMVAKALNGSEVMGSLEIRSLCLPCVFGDSARALSEAMIDPPTLVLCLGQAGGREGIILERLAHNRNDAHIPDNLGHQPQNQKISDSGPETLLSSLPLEAIQRELWTAGIKATLSDSAGRYVCNHVFYSLMTLLQERPDTPGGFVHLPYLPEQICNKPGMPSMPLDEMIQAVEIVLRSSILHSAIDCSPSSSSTE